MKNKILIVASHPDDECLGCFGTVARMIADGDEAQTLILGEGPTARGDKVDLFEVYSHSQKANKVIGIDEVMFVGYADNKFDTLPLLDIAQTIETCIKGYSPNIIFTHYKDDLNIDHRITYQAVITATRPMQNQCVKEIYSFEIPSSTEWSFPTSFSPDMFVDIFQTINAKLMALEQYGDELREFPHPRSLAGVEILAHYRGMQVGLDKAEAFKTVRVIR